MGLVIKEMLTPTVLGADYPIEFPAIKNYRWRDILEEGITLEALPGLMGSYEHMSYDWLSSKRSDLVETMLNKFFTVEEYIMDQISTRYGLDGDVNPDFVEMTI